MKLINEEVAVLRDTLAMIVQANMAVISNEQTVINVRQNETMKVLTLVATIFLPLLGTEPGSTMSNVALRAET